MSTSEVSILLTTAGVPDNENLTERVRSLVTERDDARWQRDKYHQVFQELLPKLKAVTQHPERIDQLISILAKFDDLVISYDGVGDGEMAEDSSEVMT